MNIFATKSYTHDSPNVDPFVEDSEKDFSCIFDMNLDTRSPFSSIILTSISARMEDAEKNIPVWETEFQEQYANLKSSIFYIKDNFRYIHNLEVEDEDFYIKVSCLDEGSSDELTFELYVDKMSEFYSQIKKYLEEFSEFKELKSESSEGDTEVKSLLLNSNKED